jgi:hypothetical protein
MATLEVSKATLKRDIAKLRDQLHVPIEYDRDLGGYTLEKYYTDIVLPGLWFRQQEILDDRRCRESCLSSSISIWWLISRCVGQCSIERSVWRLNSKPEWLYFNIGGKVLEDTNGHQIDLQAI